MTSYGNGSAFGVEILKLVVYMQNNEEKNISMVKPRWNDATMVKLRWDDVENVIIR